MLGIFRFDSYYPTAISFSAAGQLEDTAEPEVTGPAVA